MQYLFQTLKICNSSWNVSWYNFSAVSTTVKDFRQIFDIVTYVASLWAEV